MTPHRPGPEPATPLPPPAYPTRAAWLRAGGTLGPLGGAALAAAAGAALPACDLLGPLVAPVFEHGEGRGWYGCIVVNSPPYVTEEDALRVLREELDAAGRAPLDGADCPTYTAALVREWELAQQHSATSDPIIADELDACENPPGLAVEVVSSDDYDHFVSEGFSMSSVSSSSLLPIVHHVHDAIVATVGPGAEVVGILYDPYESADGWYDSASNEGAEELLRLQIIDLLAWLEARGR
jgi:hypothetical protein